LRSGTAILNGLLKQAPQTQPAQEAQPSEALRNGDAVKAQPKLVLPPPKVPKVAEQVILQEVGDGVDGVAEVDEVDEVDGMEVEWIDTAPAVGYKSALCKYFEQGTCFHGENCTFAHGVEELQPLYKTHGDGLRAFAFQLLNVSKGLVHTYLAACLETATSGKCKLGKSLRSRLMLGICQ